MKKFILFLFVLVTCYSVGYAQCDKKLLLTASQTLHIDSSGVVERTVDEKSVIHINQSEMTIVVNDGEKMVLNIKSMTCKWETAFKEGKSVIKGTAARQPGDTLNITVNVEGKDGKVSLLIIIEGRPSRIKVVLDKFEEDA